MLRDLKKNCLKKLIFSFATFLVFIFTEQNEIVTL